MSNDPLFTNKLFGGILLAGVLATGSAFVADLLYHQEKAPDASGFTIEVAESSSASNAPKEKVDIIQWENVSLLINTAQNTGGDVLSSVQEAGQKAFKKCASCHSIADGASHKTGPNLWAVLDRPIASAEGYKFSDALAEKSNESWTYEQLNAFLAAPKTYAPGTKMSYKGLKKTTDRAALLIYLANNPSG